MKKLISLLSCGIITFCISAQQKPSPYQTNVWKDGAAITTGVGLTTLGFLMIQNKDQLTQAEVLALDKNDLWVVDRWAAGYNSAKADELSYIPFYVSFGLPLAFLAGKRERNNFGQISVLFIETMAAAGAAFTLTAGGIQKSRPLVYDENLGMEDRMDRHAQRSFIAGHTAATAAATFFTAKVFSDFNPDSPTVPYIWAGAAAIPALVGYLRIIGGKHFLSDNLVGYIIGAGFGILIPELHKTGREDFDVSPASVYNIGNSGVDSHGLRFSFSF